MPRALLTLLLLASTVHAAEDLERKVAMMAKIGFAGNPLFSPDGKQIAFLANISGSPQVWIVSSDGGWPDQVTALDDPVSALEWSPNGEWIAIQVAPGGGLNEQIYLVHPDGSDLRRITEGGKVNTWLGKWTPDSKALVIRSSRRTPAAVDIWLVDVASGNSRMIAQSNGISDVEDVSDDGKYVLVSRLASRGDNNVYRVALDGSGEVQLTPHTPPATFVNAHFGASPDVVYITGNPDRDFYALGRVTIRDAKAGSFEVIAQRPDADLTGAWLNDARTMVVVSWNIGGRSEISLLDLRTQIQSAWTLPQQAELFGGVDFAADGSKFAAVLSGSTAPSDVWVFDLASKSQRQTTRVPHAGVNLKDLVRPELVRYKAHDGLELSGWLYRPRNVKPPYAVVLSFHGGPEGMERPSMNSTYQALLANGIAVFAPNVRGSAGFGKRFVNLDNGALRVNGVRDIKSTVDHLVKEGIADPKRLGIMGGSYGGYMVMAGVTEYPDLFAAGADLFGVVNFETFFKHTEPWMAAISTKEYGDPATEAEMLRKLSPIHNVDRVKTPLIVLHGANDTNVPVVEAEQVVDSLKKRGIPVEYVLFPDEGHGWRKTPNRIRSTVAITNFFVKRLQ